MANDLAEVETKGVTMRLAELARLMGLALSAVHTDVQMGCPVVHRSTGPGDPTTINIRVWHHYKIGRARDDPRGRHPQLGDARQRALEATAAKREAEVAKMRGELVPLDAIAPLIEDGFINFRTKIDALEERLAAEYGKELARAAQDFIIAAINDVVESVVEESGRLDERS